MVSKLTKKKSLTTNNNKVYDGLEPISEYLSRNGQGTTKTNQKYTASPHIVSKPLKPKRQQSIHVQQLKRETGLD